MANCCPYSKRWGNTFTLITKELANKDVLYEFAYANAAVLPLEEGVIKLAQSFLLFSIIYGSF